MRQLFRTLALLLALTVPAAAQVTSGWTPDITVSQSLTGTGTVIVTTQGAGSVSLLASGSGSGLTFAAQGLQGDGVTWVTLPAIPLPGQGPAVTSMGANGQWIIPAAGYQTVRVNLTAISGGTETFSLEASTRQLSSCLNCSRYEFNVGVIPTVTASAYAAGQSLGGLQTVSVGSTNSLTGVLNLFGVESKGGSTVQLDVYIWDTNPSNTTCTNLANFVVSQTDNQHLITGKPISVTPALAAGAQDTHTYASATALSANFANGSTNTNLYVCVLAHAAVTPASTTDLRFQLTGSKDAP